MIGGNSLTHKQARFLQTLGFREQPLIYLYPWYKRMGEDEGRTQTPDPKEGVTIRDTQNPSLLGVDN